MFQKFRHMCKPLIALAVVLCTTYGNTWAQCTPPGATAGVSAIISCSHPNVTLSGQSPTAGVTYSWTGPNGYSSYSQNPVVYQPGNYVLTVTTSDGLCSSMDSVIVFKNDTLPSANAGVSGQINCAVSSVTLQASTNAASPAYHWIGPNNYSSYQQNPAVSISGGYTLVVTDQANGCASTATVDVIKSVNHPLASAYVYDNLTCTVDSVQLTSSSPTSAVTFGWNGPNSYNSAEQNPFVSAAGNYTVTVTDTTNACTSSASVTVSQDVAAPGATITASASVITCSTINSTLSASSQAIGVNYAWSGPNGYNSDVQNIVVATAGSYVLQVTRVSNGCQSQDTFYLAVNKVKPGALATPSGQLNCVKSSITLQGSATASNVGYRWMGPSAFGISYQQNPTTAYRGGYLLTVTSADNGCQSQAIAIVTQNLTLPSTVSALNDGPLTCTGTIVNLTGNSLTSGAGYSWSGPGGFASSSKDTTATSPGTYYLTVSHPVSGCTVTVNTAVGQNITPPASVLATNNGDLTCTDTTRTISGSSATSNVAYSWTGPGNFSSASQSAVVGLAGTYHLTVTSSANGCTDTASTLLTQNLAPPASIDAVNNGPLTCSDTSVILTGSSATPGVSYSWFGPGNFTSTAKDPTVFASGTYNLTVKNTITGCTAQDSTIVTEDVSLPGVTASPGGTLTCAVTAVSMSASSPTQGVSYNWTGPGNYHSAEQFPSTNIPGDYTVTAINPANNCASSFTITVPNDTIAPAGVLASAPDTLTCTVNSVAVTGTSGTGNVTFNWNGPNGYTSGNQNLSVGVPGNYILTVTSNSNGCFTTDSATVAQNVVKPGNVNASTSGDITCVTDSVTLTASSSTGGVIYSWSGPSFSSAEATPLVGSTGTYFVTVTDPVNGCFETRSVTVNENKSIPGGITSSVSGVLTCAVDTVTVTTSSTTGGVEYSWSGPGSFASILQTPSVIAPGNYVVTVTDPVNGCFKKDSVTVTQDITPPTGVNASAGGILTCIDTTITLTGTATTSPVTYSWSGPAGYTSTFQNPVVNAPGVYIFTATKPGNGCSALDSVTVTQDTTKPADVTATVSNALDCINSSAFLMGSSSTSSVDYLWTDPFGGTQTGSFIIVVFAGDYTLRVTNSTNGCYVEKTATVQDNTSTPTCSIDVPDSSSVQDSTTNTISTYYSSSYSYSWSLTTWTPVSGANTQTLTYLSGAAGTSSDISVQVTDNTNGCVTSCGVTLLADSAKAASEEFAPSSQMITDVTLNAYPVPSTGKIFLEFESPVATSVNIKVYNTSGELVATLFNANVKAGEYYKVTFNENGSLPPGPYYSVLKTNEKTVVSKLIIQ